MPVRAWRFKSSHPHSRLEPFAGTRREQTTQRRSTARLKRECLRSSHELTVLRASRGRVDLGRARFDGHRDETMLEEPDLEGGRGNLPDVVSRAKATGLHRDDADLAGACGRPKSLLLPHNTNGVRRQLTGRRAPRGRCRNSGVSAVGTTDEHDRSGEHEPSPNGNDERPRARWQLRTDPTSTNAADNRTQDALIRSRFGDPMPLTHIAAVPIGVQW